MSEASGKQKRRFLLLYLVSAAGLAACETDEQIALKSRCDQYVRSGYLNNTQAQTCTVQRAVFEKGALSLSESVAENSKDQFDKIAPSFEIRLKALDQNLYSELERDIAVTLTASFESNEKVPNLFFVKLKGIGASAPNATEANSRWYVSGSREANGGAVILQPSGLTLSELEFLDQTCGWMEYSRVTSGCTGVAFVRKVADDFGMVEFQIDALGLELPTLDQMRSDFYSTETQVWKKVHGS
jgi:hypothetical protein